MGLNLNAYRKSEWKEFRRRVIEANDFQCSCCHKHEQEGAILQVHHIHYKKDENGQLRMPWEYAINEFEVLCKGCHARVHKRLPPADGDGWIYIDCEDKGEPCEECEYPNCSYEGLLRYVHTVYHPEWGFLNVGCNHAARLTGIEEATLRERETEEGKKHRRYINFCKKEKWNNFKNFYFRIYGHYPIVIAECDGKYSLIIYESLEQYNCIEDAQQDAFEICQIYHRDFLKQHNIPYPETEQKPRSKRNPIISRYSLTFAIDIQTGRIVHVDSATRPCICPACGKPLYADYTDSDSHSHCFVHYKSELCDDAIEQMFKQMVIQIIEDNRQFTLPCFDNRDAELYIEPQKIDIVSVQKTETTHDAIITYQINEQKLDIGVIICLNNDIDKETRNAIKQSNIPTIGITLIKQYNATSPIKFKDLKECLLNNIDCINWIYCPQYDNQVEQLIKEKESYLPQLCSQIQQEINACIKDSVDIEKVSKTFCNYIKFPESVRKIFLDEMESVMQRIIISPSEDDLKNSNQCFHLLAWYIKRDSKHSIKFIYDVVKQYGIINLAEQPCNRIRERLVLLNKVFGSYFLCEKFVAKYEMEEKCKYINDDIRKKFLNVSTILTGKSSLSKANERKNGMELFFLLFLYFSVGKMGWQPEKKEIMYRRIMEPENMPIFAAVGSLWFGHIFNIFETDDLQSFFHSVATKYPQAVRWVYRYIEQNNYYRICRNKATNYQEIETSNDDYDRWIAAVFYSAFPYIYEKPYLPYIYSE